MHPRTSALSLLSILCMNLVPVPGAYAQSPASYPRERTELRTAKTRTFEIARGSFMVTSTGNEIFAQNQNGEWKDISDEGRETQSAFVFDLLPQGVDIVFDRFAPKYTYVIDGISYIKSFAGSAEGTLEGNVVTYALADHVTLRWTVNGAHITEEIVVETDAPLPDLRFAIKSEGLIPMVTGTGLSYADEEGTIVIHGKTPVLLDANGSALERSLAIEKSSDLFSYAYDANGLPYPYIIDPSEGPLAPSVTENDGSNGIVWSNTDNAIVNDGVYSTSDLLEPLYDGDGGYDYNSDDLKTTAYGFALPSDAYVEGIEMEYEAKQSSGTTNLSIQPFLYQGGSQVFGNPAGPITISDTVYEDGGAADLWDVEWTYEEINDSGFGAGIFAYTENNGCITSCGFVHEHSTFVSIDYIALTVYYSIPLRFTGLGSGNNCSTAENWTDDTIPVIGDRIIIPSSVTKNVVWDPGCPATVSSMVVENDFGFNVTLGRSLEINGPFTLSGGTFVQATHALSASGETFFSSTATFTKSTNGTAFTLDGDLNLIVDSGDDLGNLVIGHSPDYIILGSNLVATDLTIDAGDTLDTNGFNVDIADDIIIDGELSAYASSVITLGGDWTNNGIYYHNSDSTVIFDGGNQSINGSSDFYNLTKTVTAAATLTFEAGETQTVTGALTLNGASGNLLSLRSSSNGVNTFLTLDVGESQSLEYLDVRDNDASNGQELDCLIGCTDTGNNFNWNFGGGGGGGGEPVPEFSTWAMIIVLLICGGFLAKEYGRIPAFDRP